jgi:hypothetical protein
MSYSAAVEFKGGWGKAKEKKKKTKKKLSSWCSELGSVK